MSIQYDSRNVCFGDIFFALPGARVDGRDYIQQAIDRGASKVIYEQNEIARFVLPETDIPLRPVKNLTEKQGQIAATLFDNPSKELEIIGITGTNGKTSVSYFLAQCLSDAAIIGTTGYGLLSALKKIQYTTPPAAIMQEMLATLRDDHIKRVALEVSSHGLSQHRLDSVDIDIAVFTNLSRDHLDFHGSMAAYAAAKKRLFEFETLRGAVVNHDDALGREILHNYEGAYPILSYSMKNRADIFVHHSEHYNEGFQVDIETPWGRDQFQIPLLGHFNIENCLAVIGVLGLLNVPFKEIHSKIATLKPPAGRMTRYTKSEQPMVIVDFAHTPDALRAVLLALRQHCSGRLYCVFGCGGDRDLGKRALMGQVASEHSDAIFITNDNPRTEDPAVIAQMICSKINQDDSVHLILDRRAAIMAAIKAAQSGDIVLIAGKGHEVGQIFADKILPFNDGEVVKEALDLQTYDE